MSSILCYERPCYKDAQVYTYWYVLSVTDSLTKFQSVPTVTNSFHAQEMHPLGEMKAALAKYMNN